ncbi:MAG: hypothetical protein FWD68_18780 [Alphaproteobacteria bacterium]|nr:hypothetical protein [Alphaproteobacteria bacterium]
MTRSLRSVLWTIVLSSVAQIFLAPVPPAGAGDDTPRLRDRFLRNQDNFVGRWQERGTKFTMDLVRCGDGLCGTRVVDGRCAEVVLKPHVESEDFEKAALRYPKGRWPRYDYRRPDRKGEFVVFIFSLDESQEPAMRIRLRGGTASEARTPIILGHLMPPPRVMDEFDRIGDVECRVPAP